jgi:hypothetical protein
MAVEVIAMLLDGATVLNRYDAKAGNGTLLVGIKDAAGLQDGVLSLNHKDAEASWQSTAEFVAARSRAEIDEWKSALRLGVNADAPYAGQTIVVEDTAPDTCLTLVVLARRLANQDIPLEWVDYSRLWEQGFVDATGEPRCSFGALLSALTHADLQESASMENPLRSAVAYTRGLVDLGVSPAALPRLLPGATAELQRLHGNAHSRLAYEEVIYRRVSDSSTKLQLEVHMRDSNRKALVDAVLFSEVTLTSTLKNNLRTDSNSYTGRGYGFMGLFRPGEVGTGNDITVSTDPAANLSLRALWTELERMEEERWAEFACSPGGFPRPRGPWDRDRHLSSHAGAPAPIAPCHQPWYDDKGDATLLAAPRFIERDGKRLPGTLLKWADVKHAIWRCYAPTLALRLRGRGAGGAGVSLTDGTPEAAQLRCPLAQGTGLFMVDVVRMDGFADDVVVWSPTMSAACAAFLESGLATIDNLPPASAFDQLEDRGGIVFVTENGAMLLNMSGDDSFPADELARAARDVAQTVACAVDLEDSIRRKIRGLVENAITTGDDDTKRTALKEIYAAKLRGRRIWDSARRAEADNLVRRFRTLCEQRWQARSRLDAALDEIAELEAMIVSSSEFSANALINKLAVYGLPLSVFGNLLGGLLLFDTSGGFKAVSWIVALFYLGLVLLGMAALTFYARRARKKWRLERDGAGGKRNSQES